MDANGARFWMLAGPTDLTPASAPARVQFDPARSTWKLASSAPPPSAAESETLAAELVLRPRRALDELGSVAEALEVEGQWRVVVRAEGLPDAEVFAGPERIDDLAIDADGVIRIAAGGALWQRPAGTLGDDREEWQRVDDALLQDDGPAGELSAFRLAMRPNGGAFVLDREHGLLALWTGVPLRNRPSREEAPGTFRPRPESPRATALQIVQREAFGGDDPVAIACSPRGRVAVLGWRPAGEGDAQFARLHVFDPGRRQGEGPLVLLGVRRPFSLAWVDDERLAVMTTTSAAAGGEDAVAAEALVYATAASGPVLPVGERYPLRRHDGQPFLHAPDARPRYGSASGPRPLVALSLPRRAVQGEARSVAPIDGELAGTCWHRLYVEAVLPEGCGIRVLLGASDGPESPEDFFAHDFGTVPGSRPPTPRAAWEPHASEIPSERGLLPCSPEFGRAGLFSVLIQRADRRTRRLAGRYLHVRLQFFGTGQFSPELAALRAWNPRFSYVRRYLPELYHEDPLLEDDAEPGPATRADFLERFIASFEGVLTPLEDRVAEAWRYTHPRTAPAETLDWLASWLGLSLDPALPEEARRKLVYFAPVLAAERGTHRGLSRVLEIVSDGGVSRGEIVVLEEFRLRRTWATILGVDLADETDPLLGGLTVNANSILGDTLVLGDEHRREFLALFSDRALGDDPADRAAVDDFFERTAHRASVLVFDGIDAETFGCVRRVVEREQPAHVAVEVKRVSRSFIAAVTALVGIDTRLGVEPAPLSVRLGSTRLGDGDRLSRRAALHPGLEGDAE